MKPAAGTVPAEPGPVRVGRAVVHVLGTAHGLVSEVGRVEEAFARLRPDAVGIGVAPAELDALAAHAAGQAPEEDDVAETIDPSESYAVGLSRFGEIGLPPPDLLAALGLAREAGVEPVALDLDESQYSDVFAANVGPFALFRYGRRVRRMAKRPPAAGSPREFALAWDRKIRALRGFDAVERTRERHMAVRLETVSAGAAVVLAVVDVARADGVVDELRRRNP